MKDFMAEAVDEDVAVATALPRARSANSFAFSDTGSEDLTISSAWPILLNWASKLSARDVRF
jgi:hypothetical protein